MIDRPDESQLTSLLETYLACWSAADLTGMMACCHDDFSLYLNSAGPDGGPIRLYGKAEVTSFLAPIARVAECTTVPIHISYRDGILRTQVDATVYHKNTGHTLRSRYRQVIQFYGAKLIASEEFHDTAMMRAFWDLVNADESFKDGTPRGSGT